MRYGSFGSFGRVLKDEMVLRGQAFLRFTVYSFTLSTMKRAMVVYFLVHSCLSFCYCSSGVRSLEACFLDGSIFSLAAWRRGGYLPKVVFPR
jgi:hypothetical protein